MDLPLHRTYGVPLGGLQPPGTLLSGRAVFTTSYAVIPRGVLTDIVVSALPNWHRTRAWILARPMTGFAETFAQYAMEVAPGGGSDAPEPDRGAEGGLFMLEGSATVTVDGTAFPLAPGRFAYVPPAVPWHFAADGSGPARFHWIRKRYRGADGLPAPDPFVRDEAAIDPIPLPGFADWSTTMFMDPADLRHDMHVNIVNFAPGGSIPFLETHVMEHGLTILEGRGVYRLNEDWVEVEAGDFLWLRAFCPQACYAGGPGRFRYLLYKDVNRHPALTL